MIKNENRNAKFYKWQSIYERTTHYIMIITESFLQQILYTYTVSRVTYTDEYRACIRTSDMSLYTSPY